ncbi:cobalamin-dependent protein [Desulfobacter postgatei]|uniref:cobalamin B12-binding domain-containing protein n=1 Tax=Desulfobacter postgatei TaxID=2293 RepID=UPI00259AF570|nr:cobalamin-dependent protein [uncultured Desulfobacter sp.]
MIDPGVYSQYLTALLKGDRQACARIVQSLIDSDIEIRALYRELFEKTLYEVGHLWETNKISVAREHLATAITESLMSMAYPYLFKRKPISKKVIISCAVNEYHQIGGKMVADIFEMNGWDSYFLGARTPTEQMIAFIEEVNPDLLGLSLSIHFNFPALKREIETVNHAFPDLEIIIGGQAFQWGDLPLKGLKNLRYIRSLEELEKDMGGE